MLLRHFCVLWSLVLAPLAAADEIDDLVKKTMETDHLPGVCVGIFRDGKVVRVQGYGYADLEKKIEVKADTIFRIASMSKAFCSGSIMMLVQQGKIKLDAPITEYLKDAPPTWSGITIDHLLHHQSGIPNVTDLKDFKFAKDWKEEEFIEFLKPKPLDSEPGTVYKYNNSGFSILGILVHRISGTPLGEFVKENIFTPLDMNVSGYFKGTDKIENMATGYEWRTDKHVLSTRIRPGAMGGSGGVCTNIFDLAKWDDSWFGNKLFSDDQKKLIWTPGTLKGGKKTVYGMGWTIRQKPEGLQVSHSGSTAGFTSNIIRQTWDKVTVVVLRNVQMPGAEKLSEGILDLYRKSK